MVLGEGSRKITPSVLSDLKRDWTKQFQEFQSRSLSGVGPCIEIGRATSR